MSRVGLAPAIAVLVCAGCAQRGARRDQGFVDADVSAVCTRSGGQVSEVRVEEGVAVRRGEVLAELDAADRRAEVSRARANLERSRQTLRSAEESFRAALPPVRGASAEIAGAQATRDEAEVTFERTQRLFESRVVAQADLDAARARRDAAQARVDSLIASRSGLRGQAAAARVQIFQARAQVRSMEASLEAAQVQLAWAQVLSPFDGVVVEVLLHEGEWAAAGAAVVMVEDRSRLWVRLDIGESRLGGLRLGQPAEVTVLALPGERFTGKVSEISALGDFALNRDVRRGTPDLRTFEVRVALTEQALLALRPGMTAFVQWPEEAAQRTAR